MLHSNKSLPSIYLSEDTPDCDPEETLSACGAENPSYLGSVLLMLQHEEMRMRSGFLCQLESRLV